MHMQCTCKNAHAMHMYIIVHCKIIVKIEIKMQQSFQERKKNVHNSCLKKI